MPSKKRYGNTQERSLKHQRLSERVSSPQPASMSQSQDGGKVSISAPSSTTQHLEAGQSQNPGLSIPPGRIFQSVQSTAASTSQSMPQAMSFLPSTAAEQPILYTRGELEPLPSLNILTMTLLLLKQLKLKFEHMGLVLLL